MLRAISMIWVLLAASCAGTGHPSLLENCPVTPMAVKDLPQGLLLRARVRMSARNHEASFEVIAHATTKELTLVGIAPYGMRLFEIQQSGLEFHQTTSASAEAQGLAIFTADALYRAYWIEPPGQKNSWVRDGETITDSDTGSKRGSLAKTPNPKPHPQTQPYNVPGEPKTLQLVTRTRRRDTH